MRVSRGWLVAGILAISVLPSVLCRGGEITGDCSTCHTMHNSQEGKPVAFVLNGSGQQVLQSQTFPNLLKTDCLGCHSSVGAETVVDMGGSKAPIVFNIAEPTYPPDGSSTSTLAGGNFHWLVTNGDPYGHNVYGLAGVDTRFPDTQPAPGGATRTGDCVNCHYTLATAASGCEGCHVAMHHSDSAAKVVSGKDQGWYRLLGSVMENDGTKLPTADGVEGIEDPNWEQNPLTNQHNVYQGSTVPYTGYLESLTIDQKCRGCHGTFHDQTIADSTWIRHPVDYAIPDSGRIHRIHRLQPPGSCSAAEYHHSGRQFYQYQSRVRHHLLPLLSPGPWFPLPGDVALGLSRMAGDRFAYPAAGGERLCRLPYEQELMTPFACKCRKVRLGRLAGMIMLLAMLGGCLPQNWQASSPPTVVGPPPGDSARINCFLVLKDDQGPAIQLEIASLDVLAGDVWLPLSRGPLTLDSTAIGRGQVFLGGEYVTPGSYRRLRMEVAGGRRQTVDGGIAKIANAPFTVEMSLSGELPLQAGDSRTLLFTWDVEKSLATGDSVQPALTVVPSLREQLGDRVFVSCPDIDTVFVVRADDNWVVDSFGLRGRPTYLAVAPDATPQRLYVLTPGDRKVKIVDTSSGRTVNDFTVPLNDTPNFMVISPDGAAVFLLDEESGYLSRMDLANGRIDARILVGYGPDSVMYLPDQGLLAVSLSLSQQVVLLDPLSLAVKRTLRTGSNPQGLAVSGNQLYVAENDDNTVSVIDLSDFKTVGRVAVGFGPRRLLSTDNQLYVSNQQEGTLSVLMSGQLGVVQVLSGFGRPLEMAFDQFYQQLYVTDEENNALDIVKGSTNRLLGRLSLGAKPLGLVVVVQ